MNHFMWTYNIKYIKSAIVLRLMFWHIMPGEQALSLIGKPESVLSWCGSKKSYLLSSKQSNTQKRSYLPSHICLNNTLHHRSDISHYKSSYHYWFVFAIYQIKISSWKRYDQRPIWLPSGYDYSIRKQNNYILGLLRQYLKTQDATLRNHKQCVGSIVGQRNYTLAYYWANVVYLWATVIMFFQTSP